MTQSINVKDPLTLKALQNLDKEKAPKQLKIFTTLTTDILGELKEGEFALADDGTNCHMVWVENGRLFKVQGTEVT